MINLFYLIKYKIMLCKEIKFSISIYLIALAFYVPIYIPFIVLAKN